MRFRTVEEAMAYVKGLMKAKDEGKREYLTGRLDEVPQWSKEGKTPEPKLNGSEVDLVYLAYKLPTEKQKRQARPAKSAGVRLERITGRLVDVRTCKDGTVQVLFTNGLRDAEGNIPYRGPNVDKGILCALSINEGLGEKAEDIIARVPLELLAALETGKELQRGKGKQAGRKVATPSAATVQAIKEQAKELDAVPVAVVRINAIIEVPSTDSGDGTNRMKLK